ncbi:MAG: hypothetical protein ABSE71_04155, partial [Candidatus Micrarchaeaceae archaeon]
TRGNNPNPVMQLVAHGLIPIFPTTAVPPVDSTGVSASTAKLPADPRAGSAGPAALTECDRKKTSKIKPNRPNRLLRSI